MTYATEVAAITREPTTIVTLKLDFCTRTFNIAPCTPPGGTKLCYNTFPSCTFRSAYVPTPKDYKFTLRKSRTPFPGESIRPYIHSITTLGQEIKPDKSVIINQRVTIKMVDEQDRDIGIDPYRSSETQRIAGATIETNTATGTFWRKLKARNANYKNRRVTIQEGFEGLPISEYRTTFEGVLSDIEIDAGGQVNLIVKGLLQLTDVDFPKKTDGKTFLDMGISDVSVALIAWTGVDNSGTNPTSQYAASGYLKIDSEIIQYTSLVLDTTTGITTISGLTRGQFNADGWDKGVNPGEGVAHTKNKMVQQVEVFIDQHPIDIINTLLNRAAIVNADIDTALFASERDDWLPGVLFRGILSNPTKIKTYIKELREQTLTSIWQGEDQKIKIKFLGPNKPGQAYRRIKDAENIVFRSRSTKDNEDKRITRVSVFYDIFANKKGGDSEDYALGIVSIDGDAESQNEFNEVKEKPDILSRWIRTDLGGETYSRLMGERILIRFRGGPKDMSFDVELKDEAFAVGEVFELETRDRVDFDGNPKIERYQVVKKQRTSPGRFRIKAIDTKIKGRPFFMAPDTTPDYLSATAAEKEFGFMSDGTPPVMPDGSESYGMI